MFPDDEALVQAEFENTLNFSLSLARSATRPDNPESPVGIQLQPFYLDQAAVDPENTPLSMLDFTFDVSYGDPQEVRVLAKRSLGERDGAATGSTVARRRSDPTSEWTGGERYGAGKASYYRVMRGTDPGGTPGQTVKVWFEGGNTRSERSTTPVVSDTGDDVLVLAAEDYTGASPVQADRRPAVPVASTPTRSTANGIAYRRVRRRRQRPRGARRTRRARATTTR